MPTPPPKTQDEELAERLGIVTQTMVDRIDEQAEFVRYQNIMFRMLRRKPFFASLIGRMRVHTGKAALKYTRTACVWVGQDLQVHLAINPFYIAKLQREEIQRGPGALDDNQIRALTKQGFKVLLPGDTVSEDFEALLEKNNQPAKAPGEWMGIQLDHDTQIALLIHECLHVVHLHLIQGQADKFPDQQLTNIAMDIAINQHISDKPDTWLDRDTYAPWGLMLPENKDFAYYYRELTEFFKRHKRGEPPKQPPGTQGAAQQPAVQGLLYGTQIATPKGLIPIQDLGPGDTVYSLDTKGALVPRLILHRKMSPMAATTTPQQQETEIYSLRTENHGLARVSSKVKVHSKTQGWIGIGTPTTGQPAQLSQGEEITVFPTGSGASTTQPVSSITRRPGRNGDRLYQLLVDPGDTVSSFFANGIFVRGLQPVDDKGNLIVPTGGTP